MRYLNSLVSEGKVQMSEIPEYEFDQSQNELILDLSQKMLFVGYFFMGLGVLAGIRGGLDFLKPELLVQGVGQVVVGVVQFLIGLWTLKASSSFKLIVKTEGNDIGNLMGSLGQLRKLYGLKYWLLILSLVFFALSLVLSSV